MSSELIYRPVAELAELLAARRISSVELTAACIARTKAVEDRVRAFNSYDEADARPGRQGDRWTGFPSG